MSKPDDTAEWGDEGLLSVSDAARIGFKLVEMADRLVDVDAALPGSQAKWAFEIDGKSFDIVVTRAATSNPEGERG